MSKNFAATQPDPNSKNIIVFPKQSKKLSQLLLKIGKKKAELLPGAWILAAAQRQLNHATPSAAPKRWWTRLHKAFPKEATHSESIKECASLLEKGLSKEFWLSPDLLGSILLTFRENQRTARLGRHGRRSNPTVYTPYALAKSMVADVCIGPKQTLDPACGAGVFLLAAFNRAYWRRVESDQQPKEAARAVLKHELAGVDIDTEALAIAEFSLRMAAWNVAGFDEDIDLNLSTSNTLESLGTLESFAEVIIGNPPYMEGRGLTKTQISHFRKRFKCAATGKVNLFAIFLERSLELLQDGGVLSFIVPSTFQRNDRYLALRELLLNQSLESITPIPTKTFNGSIVETVVLRIRKQTPPRDWQVLLSQGRTPQQGLAVGPSLRFCVIGSEKIRKQIHDMDQNGVELGTCFEVRDGISTGFQPFPKILLGEVENDQFIAKDGSRMPFNPDHHKKVIGGSEFSSFSPVAWKGLYIHYDKKHEHDPPHPGRPFNCQLRDPELFDRAEKMVTRQTAKGLIATVDRKRYFTRNSVHLTFQKKAPSLFKVPDLSLAALCACFNSQVYQDYFLAVTGEEGAVFPQVHIADLKRLPIIPTILHPGSDLHRLGIQLLKCHASKSATSKKVEKKIETLKQQVEDILQKEFNL